jgi:hypothetical protein
MMGNGFLFFPVKQKSPQSNRKCVADHYANQVALLQLFIEIIHNMGDQ